MRVSPAELGVYLRLIISVGSDDAEVISRFYGKGYSPCIVIFPGRHGGVQRYENELIKIFTDHNFNVIYLSYPGQDGAKGRVKNTATLIKLLTLTVQKSTKFCNEKTFFYGRSLGSMLATIVASETPPNGLILEGASPSLSSAIRNRLNSKWYLKPYKLLPIEYLLDQDIKIKDYLTKLPQTHVVVFQGENDSITPIASMREVLTPLQLDVVSVKKGDHKNTFILAQKDIIQKIREWL